MRDRKASQTHVVGSWVIHIDGCGPNMHAVICLCGRILGNSLSFGLWFKCYVSGTFDDQGKTKA